MAKQQTPLSEDTDRLLGRDAQRNNILAARTVAEIVKTTLGPKGMDKMLVSPSNDIIVTNDGVTILDEMQIEHPAARMMVEIAKTQESEVGDGTTTAVMLAGKLLENAERLLDQKIHPTVIVKGYRLSAMRCQIMLQELSQAVEEGDETTLQQIAMTAMTGKGSEDAKEVLGRVVVQAFRHVSTKEGGSLDDIKIVKLLGDSVLDTELLSGILLSKERMSTDMPSRIDDARIALLDMALEVKNPEIDTKITLSSPEQLQNFLAQEEQTIKRMVEKIKVSGANVVFCQKGVDEFAQFLLAREGIYACRRVPKSDMIKLSKATGAKIVSNISELTSFELGNSGVVHELQEGDERLTLVTSCPHPRSVTILIRGGTPHVLDEVERAIQDGLGDVSAVIESQRIVAGGGAIEMELSKRLRDYAISLSGREQLAVQEFANALEFIPSTLAENAGLDPIDVLTELKAKHQEGDATAGLNLFTGKVEDTLAAAIIEPEKVKSQAMSSATDVATMILRIDDVIAAKRKGPMMPQMNATGGMPPSMRFDM